MNLIARWLYAYTARLPCRLITLGGQPYMERYFLGKWCGRFWYLHRFVRCDGERHVHDHPWRSATSLVLTGRYTEQRGTFDGSRLVLLYGRVLLWNRIRRRHGAIDVHRITGIRPETWTLFAHGPWEYPWGFYRRQPDGSVQYHQFKPRPTDPSGTRWWLTAPPGRAAGREPFLK